MQLAVDVSMRNILHLISQMNLKEIEIIKNKIIEKELYFKKFKKDDIEDIMLDFKEAGYSEDFLADLENGLKKSSIYNEN
ncbi:hypothetical protein [Arcobacter sp. FWKO B]|uniref:hypothetical protein n=1 Tax=Arcobacter sp. FWKO B TaxID=2593672 RepID=UPI0018A5A0C0|nr:hypothetical protein [Arcobacter sp. FWKO B]QOG12687.1 hypothetical protein FWKOB_08235 [Arcobacter sp. FWKO B]